MADEQREALNFPIASSGEIPEEGSFSPDERRVAATLVKSSVSHSGPLPDPGTLQGYEQVLKGSAERIFAMAEKQSIAKPWSAPLS